MSKAAKQVVIILGVLLLVSAFAVWSLFSQKTALQDANTQLQTEITGHKKDLAALNQKKEELFFHQMSIFERKNKAGLKVESCW